MAGALCGNATDRPALAYMFLGGARHVLEQAGTRMAKTQADPALMAEAQLCAAEMFGHDSAMVPWGCLTVEAEAFGGRIEQPLDYYPIITGRPLEDDRDLGRLARPDPSISGRMPLAIEALGQLRRGAGDDLFIIGMVVSPFLVACELRGMTNLLLDLLTDPPWVEALLDHITEGTGRYVEAMVASGAVDAVMFENAGANRELIGPHHLTQFVMPWHKRLLATARATNPDALLIEHNCADTPYFSDILENDVDAISFAHGDVAAIKANHGIDCRLSHATPGACPNRVCLHAESQGQPKARIGNVDHARIVLGATADQVYAEARACIESTRPAPDNPTPAPFVLSTGCEIPFKASVENIKALARAARAGF
jgi:uroporphyrinogen decarboxylase